MFKLAFAELDRRPFGRPITFSRLNAMLMLWLAVLIVLLLMLVGPVHAASCNTIFLTDKNGNQAFPFCKPTLSNGGPGGIDNMAIGVVKPAQGNFTNTTVQQGAPATLNATGTLTAAQLNAGIVTSTSVAAVVATLPLATAMDTGNSSAVATTSIDFFVINTGPSAVTMTTNTGWTLVGTMAVATVTSGHFRATKTGAGAWTLYRLS